MFAALVIATFIVGIFVWDGIKRARTRNQWERRWANSDESDPPPVA